MSTYTVRTFAFRYMTPREMGVGFMFRKPYKTLLRAKLAAVEAVCGEEAWEAAVVREDDARQVARFERSADGSTLKGIIL